MPHPNVLEIHFLLFLTPPCALEGCGPTSVFSFAYWLLVRFDQWEALGDQRVEGQQDQDISSQLSPSGNTGLRLSIRGHSSYQVTTPFPCSFSPGVVRAPYDSQLRLLH